MEKIKYARSGGNKTFQGIPNGTPNIPEEGLKRKKRRGCFQPLRFDIPEYISD
jgi:hypothetical protein